MRLPLPLGFGPRSKTYATKQLDVPQKINADSMQAGRTSPNKPRLHDAQRLFGGALPPATTVRDHSRVCALPMNFGSSLVSVCTHGLRGICLTQIPNQRKSIFQDFDESIKVQVTLSVSGYRVAQICD